MDTFIAILFVYGMGIFSAVAALMLGRWMRKNEDAMFIAESSSAGADAKGSDRTLSGRAAVFGNLSGAKRFGRGLPR